MDNEVDKRGRLSARRGTETKPKEPTTNKEITDDDIQGQNQYKRVKVVRRWNEIRKN